MTLSLPGEPTKAVLRSGCVLVFALRLGPYEWEPLYAVSGSRRVALPQSFVWTLEAVAALEQSASQ
jgi:hypothetical protein